MGRPFVRELEGPVYRCKVCKTPLAVPDDITRKMALSPIRIEGVPDTPEIVYEFSRLYNMFLAPCNTRYSMVTDVSCVVCSTSIGTYNRAIFDVQPSTYWVSRRKLHGPEGSDDEV